MHNYKIKVLARVKDFIQSLGEKDRAKIAAAVHVLSQGDFQSVETKSLRGPVKELIIRSYRIVFFVRDDTLWLVGGFRKKTRKTPPQEIENALNIFKILDNEK